MALVSTVEDAVEAAERIRGFMARRQAATEPLRKAV
jgi:hypothetical protein